MEFVGKIEEIKETISITHYPQGVVHLIHSFKLMRSLSTMKDNSNKKIFVLQNKMRTWYLNVINRWGVQNFLPFQICANVTTQASEVIEEGDKLNCKKGVHLPC